MIMVSGNSGVLDADVEGADVGAVRLICGDAQSPSHTEIEGDPRSDRSLVEPLQREVGKSHGFGPADPRQSNRLLRDADVDDVVALRGTAKHGRMRRDRKSVV